MRISLPHRVRLFLGIVAATFLFCSGFSKAAFAASTIPEPGKGVVMETSPPADSDPLPQPPNPEPSPPAK